MPIDGNDGEKAHNVNVTNGHKTKIVEKFGKDFPTIFIYSLNKDTCIDRIPNLYNTFAGKCFWKNRMIQCLKYEHTTYFHSILCFELMFFVICSFYSVA